MSATSDRNVALYSVLIDGAEVDETLSSRIREVRILSYLRLPDMCTISVVYKKGNEGEDQPIDSHPFDIGKPLEVKLGARDAADHHEPVQGPGRLAGAQLRRRRGGADGPGL